MNWLAGLFSGGGGDSTLATIAKEWIDTPEEKAVANALMIKTLDPNGKMRRDIARAVTNLYVLYMVITVTLIIAQAFGLGTSSVIFVEGKEVIINSSKQAMDSMVELFIPITTLFGTIISASFGVSYANVTKGI